MRGGAGYILLYCYIARESGRGAAKPDAFMPGGTTTDQPASVLLAPALDEDMVYCENSTQLNVKASSSDHDHAADIARTVTPPSLTDDGAVGHLKAVARLERHRGRHRRAVLFTLGITSEE